MNDTLSQRWEKGGDKYESMKIDETREFIERIADEQQRIIDDIRTAASCWTENTLELGADPRLEGFLLEYPELDHEEIYDIIESEIERVKGMVLHAFGD